MKGIKFIAALILLIAISPLSSWAAGTPAGTNISNSATVTYTVDTTDYSITSLPANITVSELININLLWQDSGPVRVSSGDSGQALTFLAANSGNGSETYDLSANSALGTADFNPLLSGIYFDSNGNGTYDAGTDIQYVAGVNEPTLSPDAAITLFLVNDIPPSLNDGDSGDSELTITSQTGSGPVGTIIANGGDGGLIDAVIGASGGRATTRGSYIVSTLDVVINKSAVVTDLSGGSTAMTGSTISYTLSVSVTGTGTVTGLVINDLIPANTSYKANTLRLNGSALSDAADSDAGDVGISAANTVTVTLGNVTGGSAAQDITFDVTIN
ncbi:MAG: hypothetical protein OEV42_04025 [Deltaproteobacteria bacterium]|nr:hypothetical protein [Deltaproteobacteria bacterium]